MARKFSGVGPGTDSVAHVDGADWDAARADPSDWDAGSAFGAWPTFRFVHDLRTGSILEVSALAAAATDPILDDTADSDIEPISAWMYLRPEDAVLDGYANPKVATADGSFVASSVFGYERWFGKQPVADETPKLEEHDNWPPAGWNGFDKRPGGDASLSSPAVVQKWPPVVEDPVVENPVVENPVVEDPVVEEDPVQYAMELVGTDDDDVINGTTGNDFFNGLEGDDVLNGGPGDDAFHFAGNFGQDVVIGFAGGSAGDDVIEFRGAFSNFADVLAASLQVGPNVFIELDDENAVALIDVALASLNQDDFRFV